MHFHAVVWVGSLLSICMLLARQGFRRELLAEVGQLVMILNVSCLACRWQGSVSPGCVARWMVHGHSVSKHFP